MWRGGQPAPSNLIAGNHQETPLSPEMGHSHRAPDFPISSSSCLSSMAPSKTSFPAPLRTSPPQMPLSYRDPWNPQAGQQVQSTARKSYLIPTAETAGSPRTRILDSHIEEQSAAAYMRPQRKSSNRDEFDGPHQLLNIPSPRSIAAKEQPFPTLPISLNVEEQGDILGRLNEVLSKCAFDFVARYQFPIPVDPDKRLVITPEDREWTEWVYLLKRLATKRRIPARVLHDNQIKQLVTVLENSLEAPVVSAPEGRLPKDDRSILQFISAGTQVARMLKDAAAMRHLDRLYVQTASCIQDRRWTGLPI